jgi:HSF-type DNA-binding
MSLIAKRKGEAADYDGKADQASKCDPEVQKRGEETASSDAAPKESEGTQSIIVQHFFGDYILIISCSTLLTCVGSRPKKKAKANKKDAAPPSVAPESPSTSKEAIAAKLNMLSAGASLSDYEKCSIFPQKLMQLLKNEEDTGAIWWLEDGKSFAIEQEQFTKVMNKVSRTSKKKVKLDSILRNLYRWGFKKLKDRDLPPNVLAYSHPNFKRNACVELQTFSKKAEASSAGRASTGAGNSATAVPGSMPAPTALARALSARAQAGYGDNWNDEGAADKASIMQHNQFATSAAGSLRRHPQMTGVLPRSEEERMMLQSMMLQQQQHQQQHRQMRLQQELLYHEQQQQHHRQHQALLLEAAAAERAAMGHFASHSLGGGHPSGYHFPHHPPGYPF